MQTLDSLGRICLYGGAWAKSETAAVYEKGFDLFGLSEILEVWISDNSKAAAKLASIYATKRHALCFQHFRQHLWEAIASFTHVAKTRFWNRVMKIMKWRGYNDDDALLRDIDDMIGECAPTSRPHELLLELKILRTKLCIFHVSKFQILEANTPLQYAQMFAPHPAPAPPTVLPHFSAKHPSKSSDM